MKENRGFHDHSGGAKKFLYTGSKRKAELEEEEQWSFALRGQDNSTKSTNVPMDLNNVWSIQKNVSLRGTGVRGNDRLTHNASKGFYSRHGGQKVASRDCFTYPWRARYSKWPLMTDGTKNLKPPEKSEGGPTWAPAQVSSFSYSCRGNSARDDASSVASGHVSQGYHANPSPNRFSRQGNPVDENDF